MAQNVNSTAPNLLTVAHLRTLNAQVKLDGKLLVHDKEAPWEIPCIPTD